MSIETMERVPDSFSPPQIQQVRRVSYSQSDILLETIQDDQDPTRKLSKQHSFHFNSHSNSYSNSRKKNSPRNSPIGSPLLHSRRLRRTASLGADHVFHEFPSMLRRKNSLRYSPKPNQIWAFCHGFEPLAIFLNASTPSEIGNIFRKHSEFWSPLVEAEKDGLFDPRQLDSLSDEQFYHWFDDLLLKSDKTKQKFHFVDLPLCEVGESDSQRSELKYTVLIKDNQVQEIFDTVDPKKLITHFRENYARYIPIYKWFQENAGYPDFQVDVNAHETLEQRVALIPDQCLLKYLSDTVAPDTPHHQPPRNILLKSCLVY